MKKNFAKYKTGPGSKKGSSLFRRINNWLHLWLGLVSGLIVFVVCITGCLWVFNEEIIYWFEPKIRSEILEQPVVKPSSILEICKKEFPGSNVSYAYHQQGTAIRVALENPVDQSTYILFVSPYSGHIQGRKRYAPGEADFFDVMLEGHRYLWLPHEIGRPLVNYGTLVFVVLLITGIVWWYPRKWTNSTVDKSFKIRWNAGWKRINLDFHNVLGFYSFLVLLVLALTGMVYGLKWYSEGLYWVSSGGDSQPEWKKVSSDPDQEGKHYSYEEALDVVWERMITENRRSKGFFYAFPDPSNPGSTISMRIYPSAGRFYDVVRHTFDRHTLQRLEFFEVFDKSFEESSVGAKIRRMNYDLHVGSILGLPGKVLAFLASLVGASLPVTGFIIWWNRKGFTKRRRNPVRNE